MELAIVRILPPLLSPEARSVNYAPSFIDRAFNSYFHNYEPWLPRFYAVGSDSNAISAVPRTLGRDFVDVFENLSITGDAIGFSEGLPYPPPNLLIFMA